jgi:Tol biopolymer transport system component
VDSSGNYVSAAVYVVSAFGGAERKVANLGRTLADAPFETWTPDGRGLVVVDNDPKEGEGIYLIPLGPGEKRRLTPKPKYADNNPALSPDGRFLAYAGCSARYQCVVQVLRLNAGFVPEGPPRGLRETGRVWGLAWSPDGRSLIAGLDALQRISLSDPTAEERIELAGLHASDPSVAGARNLLAFRRANVDASIWRVAEGASPEPLIASTRFENQPRYSPDGRRIAFCSNRSSDVIDVYVSEVDGPNPMQLTRGPGKSQCSPTWSPDGRQIAYDSAKANDSSYDVYVIDADGGSPRLLTPSPADDVVPLWSRDGRWIYFASNRTGRHEIWRAPAEGGDAVQITRDGGFCAEESADGRRLYYVKRESGRQPLFELPVAGGDERQVVDSVVQMKSFAVVEDGLYYWAPREGIQPGGTLRFLAFGTGVSRDLARVDMPLNYGLTVSPDRRTILFAGYRQLDFDLFLVENFR